MVCTMKEACALLFFCSNMNITDWVGDSLFSFLNGIYYFHNQNTFLKKKKNFFSVRVDSWGESIRVKKASCQCDQQPLRTKLCQKKTRQGSRETNFISLPSYSLLV